MNQKPNILVITKTKKESKKNKYYSLTNRFNLLFFKLNKNVTVDEGITSLNSFLEINNFKIDGVIAFNDDTSLLASVISQELNLNGPNPKSVCQIQHKDFFLKQFVSKKYIPNTISINHDNTNWRNIVEIDSFIKPSKGSLSEGALKITSNNKENIILPQKRLCKFERSIYKKYFDKPLNTFILQPYIDQKQFTFDAFIYKGEVTTLGITESIYDKQKGSFIRFDFPISFSQEILKNLNMIVKEILEKLNFNNSLFNLEFFISKDNKITIIELNTRPSIVFENFYQQYFKKSMTEMMIEISLNKKPELEKNNQIIKCKSFILRKYSDAVITSLPTKNVLLNIIKNNNLENIKILGKKDKKLSQQRQDSYSYRYAIIDICGKSSKEINTKYQKVKSELDNLITFSPVSH